MAVVERSLVSQAWWHRPVTPILKRLTQEDHEFEASLGYIAGREEKGKKGGA